MQLTISQEELKQKLYQIAGRLAFSIHREVVIRVPRRFRNRITVAESGGNWQVGTNDKIFRYWEKDTKPHPIRAKNRDALSFAWPAAPASLPSLDGKYFFKEVHHPGTKGKEVFKKIANDGRLLNQLLEGAMQ